MFTNTCQLTKKTIANANYNVHVGRREASRPYDECSERLPCSTDNADKRPLQYPLDRLRALPAPLPRRLPMTVTTTQASSLLVSWTLLPMTTPHISIC